MTFADWLAAGSAVVLGLMYIQVRRLNARLRARLRSRLRVCRAEPAPPAWLNGTRR